MKLRLSLIAALALQCVYANAQTPFGISVQVKETTGIRRSTYPVNARVPFAKGMLKDAERVRLMLADKEVGAQFAAESRWPECAR